MIVFLYIKLEIIMFKFSLTVVYSFFFISCNAFACLSIEAPENRQELKKVLEHFEDYDSRRSVAKTLELESRIVKFVLLPGAEKKFGLGPKLAEFIEYYPYDIYLKHRYVDLLFAQKENIKAMTTLAELILLLEHVNEDNPIGDESNNKTLDAFDKFFCNMPLLETHQIKLSRHFMTLNGYQEKPKEFVALYKLQGYNKVNQYLLGVFDSLFSNIQKIKIPTIFDACALWVLGFADQKNLDLANLLKDLHSRPNGYKSPYLEFEYAKHYIYEDKGYDNAISLMESLLEEKDGYLQTHSKYNALSCLLIKNGNLEEAIELLESVLKHSSSFNMVTCLANICLCLLKLERYDEVLIKSKEALDLFSKSTNVHHSNKFKPTRSGLKKYYNIALKETGGEKYFEELLLKKQRKALETNKHIAKLIMSSKEEKKSRIEHGKNGEKKHHNTPRASNQIKDGANFHYKNELQNSSFDNERIEENKSSLTKYEPPAVKLKKKTRGTPHQQIVSPQSQCVAQTKPSNTPFIHIDQLTLNKNAHNIFNRLFAKYDPNIKSDSNVQISLGEINCLFKALKQDFDSSKGHGSHKKLTLDFHKEQMIILTHKIYLKPEQIKALRLAFINSHIVPNDLEIIEILKKDGLLDWVSK